MLSRWTDNSVAYVVTVVAAYVPVLALSSDPPRGARLALLVVGGVAYLALGWSDEAMVRWWGLARGAAAYFLTTIALGSALIVLGRAEGFLGLLLFPLVGKAIGLLPGRAAAGVSVATWLAHLAAVGAVAGPVVGLRAGVVSAPGFLFVAFVTRVWASERRARREVERLNAALGEANERLRVYAAQAEELAAAAERARIAREIHDGLGHYLTAINVQVAAARAVLAGARVGTDGTDGTDGTAGTGGTGGADDGDWERGMRALERAQSLAREGLGEVRRSVAAFRTDALSERPLAEAVERLVDDCRAAGLDAALEVRGAPRVLRAPASLTLYRAAQEGLTNVRKHAGATRARVRLDFTSAARVRLEVEDDGRGAAARGDGVGGGADSGTGAGGGFGLLGLRERAQLLGGRVEVAERAGGGMVLSVEVPG